MGEKIDITKDYGNYRTLAILPVESKIEYETLMQPDPVNGIDVHVVLNISSEEANTGVQKELDITVAGVKKKNFGQNSCGNGKWKIHKVS